MGGVQLIGGGGGGSHMISLLVLCCRTVIKFKILSVIFYNTELSVTICLSDIICRCYAQHLSKWV